MAMVLEFKINDNLFTIEMKYIKTLFEVEKLKKVYALPKYVIGLVEHNHQIYPLISLNEAWYNKEDSWKNKNAFVLVLENEEFAILVDEIVKITEANKSENEFLEVFKDKDEIINLININWPTKEYLNANKS
jgi:chemotaxis signal transduction protein